MKKVKKDAVIITKNQGGINTGNCILPIIPTGIDTEGGRSHYKFDDMPGAIPHKSGIRHSDAK